MLPQLLGWLKDMNWPVADAVAELLSTSGAEIMPHIRVAFASDDAIWKYWLLTQLCPKLSPIIFAELRPDIEKLAADATPSDRLEDVDAAANDLFVIAFHSRDLRRPRMSASHRKAEIHPTPHLPSTLRRPALSAIGPPPA